MNVFLWAAASLVLLELPLIAFASVASRVNALAAVQTAGVLTTLALVLLAQGFERSSYAILGVVASVLTFAGSMVFVRFLERELGP